MKRIFAFFPAPSFAVSASTFCHASTEAELSETLMLAEVKIGNESLEGKEYKQ